MFPAVTSTAAPPSSRIRRELQEADFHDAYEIVFPHRGRSALDIYLTVAARMPAWVDFLMAARNRAVSLLGLKNLGHLGDLDLARDVSAYRVGDRIGIFSLLSISDDEVVLGDSDRHLDVKVSFCKLASDNRESIVATTVVHIHNRLGRVYMLLVKPFHRLIVPASLRQAAEGIPVQSPNRKKEPGS
ncbi:MAG: DUF2867 domain-containing protein [Rhodocyclaceae bacterium]